MHYITLQNHATRCTTHCNTLQHTSYISFSASFHEGARFRTSLLLADVTTRCNTLQHTATHCNTLQHTATHLFHLFFCFLFTQKRIFELLYCQLMLRTFQRRLVLVYVAVCCSELQCVAVYSSADVVHVPTATHARVCCSVLQ